MMFVVAFSLRVTDTEVRARDDVCSHSQFAHCQADRLAGAYAMTEKFKWKLSGSSNLLISIARHVP